MNDAIMPMETVLYLGTDPSQFEAQGNCRGHLIHYPVIQVVPRSLDNLEVRRAFDDLREYTHFLFTSKNAVEIFFSHIKKLSLSLDLFQDKSVIAIGKITALHLRRQGVELNHIAQQETQEGVIDLLKKFDLENAYLFLPRSALSRPVLINYLIERGIRHQACDLYDTKTQRLEPKPDLKSVDTIVFTSPSTVKAFLEIFGKFPEGKKMLAVGPITEEALQKGEFCDESI